MGNEPRADISAKWEFERFDNPKPSPLTYLILMGGQLFIDE